MARQPDGKLVLVGSTSTGGGDFAIARLNADGTPDTTFSGDGKQTVNFGGVDNALGVAIQPDGKIVVAGTGGGGNDMVVARLNADGSPDTSFSPPDGLAFVNFGGNDAANAMALQPDGKIVLVGSTDAVGSGDFAVARLNADGTPDTSFSGDGKLTARLHRRERDRRRRGDPAEREDCGARQRRREHRLRRRCATSPMAAWTPASAPVERSRSTSAAASSTAISRSTPTASSCSSVPSDSTRTTTWRSPA